MKTLPFGDIWAKYCEVCGVAADEGWLEDVLAYGESIKKNGLSKPISKPHNFIESFSRADRPFAKRSQN